MDRPFGLFKNQCRLTVNSYLNRAGEYRNFIYNLAKKYDNISVLDPKDIYCDDKFCYAIRDNKMLYADDDHHSIEGSLKQAEFFIKDLILDKANDVK